MTHSSLGSQSRRAPWGAWESAACAAAGTSSSGGEGEEEQAVSHALCNGAARAPCARHPRWRPAPPAPGPAGSTTSASSGGVAPGAKRASTEPPKPPPTIRAPTAPASFSRATVRSTASTETS